MKKLTQQEIFDKVVERAIERDKALIHKTFVEPLIAEQKKKQTEQISTTKK